MLVRWPHDVHVLVTQELADRTGMRVGALVHVQAGQAFDLNDDEAKARIEAGDVIVAEKKDDKDKGKGDEKPKGGDEKPKDNQ